MKTQNALRPNPPPMRSQAELRAYNPTQRDQAALALYKAIGDGPFQQNVARGLFGSSGLGHSNMGLADVTPLGAMWAGDEAGRQMGSGQPLAGLGNLLLATVPIPAAAKGAKGLFGGAKNALQERAAKAAPKAVGNALQRPANFPATDDFHLGQNSPTRQQLQQFGRVENVPLSSARRTQERMQWDKFNAGKYSDPVVEGFDSLPVAGRKENGEFLIFDGHHRSALARSKGESSIPMYVIDIKDYDPKNAGKAAKAAVSDAEIEALLKALGG